MGDMNNSSILCHKMRGEGVGTIAQKMMQGEWWLYVGVHVAIQFWHLLQLLAVSQHMSKCVHESSHVMTNSHNFQPQDLKAIFIRYSNIPTRRFYCIGKLYTHPSLGSGLCRTHIQRVSLDTQ